MRAAFDDPPAIHDEDLVRVAHGGKPVGDHKARAVLHQPVERDGNPLFFADAQLDPAFAHILLDDLDKELEKRGHRFCRYADDCNIYVQPKAAGERVMASLKRFLSERLRLKVNEAKSQVARPSQRKFLCCSVTAHRNPKLKVAAESTRRLCEKVRQIIRRGRGRNLRRLIAEELNPLLRGWANYFRLAETKGVFEKLDQWLRRKLLGLGFAPAKARASAYNGYGPWLNSGQSHMNAAFPQTYFTRMGLISLLQTIHARA